MTQEEKDLLLRDLCTRLPYGVKVEVNFTEGKKVKDLSGYAYIINQDICVGCSWMPISNNIKIYLRPMSSMTEEESNEFESITFPLMKKDWDGNENPACIRCIDIPKYMNFILSHHFDYQGLIEKGLAFEAPEGMYK